MQGSAVTLIFPSSERQMEHSNVDVFGSLISVMSSVRSIKASSLLSSIVRDVNMVAMMVWVCDGGLCLNIMVATKRPLKFLGNFLGLKLLPIKNKRIYFGFEKSTFSCSCMLDYRYDTLCVLPM